jgi:hypothetical protein
MKERGISGQEPAQRRNTPMFSSASELARIALEKQVKKGKTIEIPSLGIVLSNKDLKKPPQSD